MDERTLPVNGTRWCSQRLLMEISLTRIISSWSSEKMALLMTSNGTDNRKKNKRKRGLSFCILFLKGEEA